jgi:hypothetical protein
MSERGEEWVASISKEFDGLDRQGVFSHDWTLDQIRKAGIKGKPVPCSTCFTHKYKEGKLEKLKTRICIAGHKGNVKQGIHYDQVFSPSPVQHTERFLQALRVNMRLHNIAWDISQAYTWAPLPEGERIAVVYPEGFKRTNEDGEELYCVLEKNLYGMPNAARGWGQHRDEFIIKRFNEEGWRCSRTLMDPCLFVIDKYVGEGKGAPNYSIKGGQRDSNKCLNPLFDGDVNKPNQVSTNYFRSYLLIHTDDVDAYGQSLETLHEINDIMNAKWKTELVDASIMLGVKRKVNKDPNCWSVEMSMEHFIDDLYQTFLPLNQQVRKARIPSRPFPENTILTKAHTPKPGEIDRNIRLGYQRIVGSLLWCVRHVSPICQYGMSQLCKLMSAPTDLAMECALQMISYLHKHKTEGITFTECGGEPICFVDASNKDDPSDGKTQYGFVMYWGGPLTWKSSKLQHVGINSTYNEYMALTHAIKQLIWYRQLMEGCGLDYMLVNPTLVHADNKQANKLCHEDLVTMGNMYFRTHYHFNKEAVRDKYCIVQYIDTKDNISDTMTKGLGKVKIEEFKPYLHGDIPLDPQFLKRKKGPLEK